MKDVENVIIAEEVGKKEEAKSPVSSDASLTQEFIRTMTMLLCYFFVFIIVSPLKDGILLLNKDQKYFYEVLFVDIMLKRGLVFAYVMAWGFVVGSVLTNRDLYLDAWTNFLAWYFMLYIIIAMVLSICAALNLSIFYIFFGGNEYIDNLKTKPT